MALNRLKQLREAQGLSLVALAARVETSGQQISHLELGKRHLTVEWLERLASALGCHPWEIVGDAARTDPREEELLQIYRTLDAADRDALLSQAASKLHNTGSTKSTSG